MAHACAPIWTRSWISPSMAEPTRGLLDTSVVIDHDTVDPVLLPDESRDRRSDACRARCGPSRHG